MIINQLPALMAERQRETNEMVTVAHVVEATKIPHSTLSRWVKQEVTRFDADVILALCAYFQCDVGRLLRIVDVPESEVHQ